MNELHRAALRIINREDALPVGEWADAALVSAARLDQLKAPDNAVRRVAALAPLIAADQGPRPSPLRHLIWECETPADIRRMLGGLTHATSLPPDSVSARLMAQAEKELLAPDPIAPQLDTALLHWTMTLASRPLDPGTAFTVARFQERVLGHGQILLGMVEPTDELDSSRITNTLKGAGEQWVEVQASLADLTNGRRAASRPDLMLAQYEMEQALRREKDPVAALTALARTDFAGNLAAAQAVHTFRPDQELLTASRHLIDAVDHLDPHQLRPTTREDRKERSPEAELSHGITHTQSSPGTGGPDRLPAPVATLGLVDPDLKLTREIEADLARRRDLGILADAALSGVPTALAITNPRGVTPAQLQHLSQDGQVAVAQLVVSVQPAVQNALRRGPTAGIEDFVQDTTATLLTQARQWDPNREGGVRWLTLAIRYADYGRSAALRDLRVRPGHQSTFLKSTFHDPDNEIRKLAAPENQIPETHVIEHLTAADQLQKVRDTVEELNSHSDPAGVAVSLYLGLHDQPPMSTDAVAEHMSISPSTASRHVNRGLLAIREESWPPPTLHSISGLDPEVKQVLTKRYGLDGNPPKTLPEIGAETGLTNQRVVSTLLQGLREQGARQTPTPRHVRIPTLEELSGLTPAQAQVVASRFGLDQDPPKTFAAIAQDRGVGAGSVHKQFETAMHFLGLDAPHLAQATTANIPEIQASLDRMTKRQQRVSNTDSTPLTTHDDPGTTRSI